MTHDPGPTPLGGLPDPDRDPVAAAVARSLAHDADELEPTGRLDDLRAAAGRGSRRPVVLVVAACAALVLVVGGVAAGLHWFGGTSTPTPPAGPTTGAAPTPSGGSTGPSGPTGSGTASPTSTSGPARTVALPVYYLGPDGDRLALFREFHRTSLAADADPVRAAVAQAVTGRATDPDLTSPWSASAAAPSVSGTDGAVVTVDLDAVESQADGRTAQQARLAAQQLVWTVTAVRQDPATGVRLLLDGKPGRLFGSLPVGAVMHRASPSYDVLGSIWVESPAEGQAVSSPVTVRGSACTFEASIAWELRRGSARVRSGHTTASSGCPVRGQWSVELGRLPAGSYTFRAYEPPASGQGPDREDTRVFRVR